MGIVQVILQLIKGIILPSNHADSTKVIQMLSRKFDILMKNIEMKLQILLFLTMT